MDFFVEHITFFKIFAILALSISFVGIEKALFHRIYPIINVFILAFCGFGIMRVLNIPISAIIAFGGVGGIAVGFAAKDLLANVFGGLMIYFDRQFKVGDWIRSPDREIEGTVEHIGWRLTQIRTFDKGELFVPNSLFSTIALENLSRMTHRKIKATLSLKPQDGQKIGMLVEEMEGYLRSNPKIDSTSDCYVKLVGFGSTSLEVMIYAFTNVTHPIHFQAVQQEVLLKMLELVAKYGCHFAYSVKHPYLMGFSETVPPG